MSQMKCLVWESGGRRLTKERCRERERERERQEVAWLVDMGAYNIPTFWSQHKTSQKEYVWSCLDQQFESMTLCRVELVWEEERQKMKL